MRIIHVHYDGAPIGGASIAMLRMHNALRKAGHDSLILCRREARAPDSVAIPIPFFAHAVLLLQRLIVKLLSGVGDTTSLTTTGMAREINARNPDMVILHWIQGDTIAVSELPKIAAPVFWYHHDLWPIRGVTAHQWFRVRPRINWLDKVVRWNKRRVARIMGDRLVPVCASQWVARQIQASGMYSRPPVVIALPLDGVFKEGERSPSVRFRILNGARGGFSPGIKGGDRLLEALGMLPVAVREDLEMVVFGESKEPEVRNGIRVTYVGRIFGEELAQQYRDADIFAFPSRQETFGQTKIEALACGTPVVAFDETACAEGIRHGETGWVAEAGSVKSFAEGILYFYKAWKSGRPIRLIFDTNRYSFSTIARSWESAFEGVAGECS